MPSESVSTVSITERQLKELTARLDAIIRLQCASLPETVKQSEKIKLLNSSGLNSTEIGGILGIKGSTVRGVLSRSKASEGSESLEEGSAQKQMDESGSEKAAAKSS